MPDLFSIIHLGCYVLALIPSLIIATSIDYSKLETALKTVTGADKDWDYLKTMLPEIQSKLRSMFTPQ